MNDLIGKTLKTKGGFDVEIIAVRPELKQPIIGISYIDNTDPQLEQWFQNGQFHFHFESLMDLILEKSAKIYNPFDKITYECVLYCARNGVRAEPKVFISLQKWDSLAEFAKKNVKGFTNDFKRYDKIEWHWASGPTHGFCTIFASDSLKEEEIVLE